jgi:hypothetical protein
LTPERVTFRAGPAAYLVGAMVLLVLPAVALLAADPGFGREARRALLVLLGCYVLWWVWIGSMRVRLEPRGLAYRVVAREFSIEYADIDQMKVDVGPAATSWYRLLLRGRYGKEVAINIKPFSRSDLVRLARALRERAPQAVADVSVIHLAADDLGPLVRTSIRKMFIYLGYVLVGTTLAAVIRRWLRAG